MQKQNILDYLKENILITDGAMGTYYRKIKGSTLSCCESANINDKETVVNIHKSYIEAGAKLIRTNTFAANSVTLDSLENAKNVIINGIEAAKEAASLYNVYIGASIGPIPVINNNVDLEYKNIADIFLSNGINIFVFETFNNLNSVKKIAKYIKEKSKDSIVLTQFALTDTGITKKSISAQKIIDELSDYPYIDLFGFNCGVGPLHMYNILKSIKLSSKIMSALPNAGYPEVINEELEYVMSSEYFAETMLNICRLGIKIIGGCCGTTPKHINLLRERIASLKQIKNNSFQVEIKSKESNYTVKLNTLEEKFNNNKFMIAVELDPPFKLSIERIIDGARVLKENGVDLITIADSPMGKSRADSIIISSKIKRETGMETLPHICCRDKNSVALRSSVLGAYIEGIRNFLVVTGDPLPGELKSNTKSVFNLNSYSLVQMISEMNNSIFCNEPVKIGGALNFNVKNKESEYKRMEKKIESGAEFFLTQPIFTEETVNYIKSIPKERNYKLFGGIMPLVTYNNVQFINNELPGITVPSCYADRFSPEMSREEAENTGINIALEIADKIKNYVDGFYIIAPFNRYEMIVKIIKKLNI